ncbi:MULTISPECIES: helix-turn-helix domain-containing protein [Natrialbaceae]|uniref:DNA binding protein n=2 Tax=Natrialbaceae TaxID=1644061 RepID=L9XKA6_9EURY|nr:MULTISPECIES: helix-turn-helix domain-containing protein [Natrialbaceae]ELY62170.1 DNA binding protein [Natronococcus jeotgali DSM 18795]
MTLVVEFDLISDRLPLTAVAATAPDSTLRIDDILISERSRPVIVFWAKGGTFDTLEPALDETAVATYSVLGTTQNRRLYRVELSEQPPAIYTEFVRLDTAPINATITPTGWRARIRFADREELAEFYDSCETYDITFRLDQIFEASPETDDEYGLTPKQRETLLAAHEAGYFSIPRTGSLAEIGAEFGVSAPSVSERLRRAQDRLIRHTVALDERH